MTLIDPSRRYISRASVVYGYPRDKDVRLKQREAEASFRSLTKIQAQSTNVPDELDPRMPRLVFRGPQREITVSQTAAQLNLHFEGRARASVDEAFKALRGEINAFEAAATKFSPEVREQAVIMFTQYPCDLDRQKVSEYLFKSFLSLEQFGDVASVAFNVGFQTKEDLFANVAVGSYTLTIGDVEGPAGRVLVDLTKVKPSEQGIEVKLDINNKPRLAAGKAGKADLSELLLVAERFITENFDGLAKRA